MVMSNVSVLEAAELTGKSSQTIYRHIKQGKVSRTDEGIDTSELIRVYGALRNTTDTTSAPTGENSDTEVEYLKRENRILREQLEKTEAREMRLHQLIENRLPAPGADTGASIVDKIKDKFF
jgi:hypothetical protein